MCIFAHTHICTSFFLINHLHICTYAHHIIMLTSPIQLYKKAYSGLSLNSWYLCLVMLVNRSGTMVIPFMTIYCTRQLHFTIIQAGYIMGLFGLGSILGAFGGGKLTDKIGFYDLQIGALFSGGVLFIILGFQHTFVTLGAGAFILSLCNESFRPANSAAIAYYSWRCTGWLSGILQLPFIVLGRWLYQYVCRAIIIKIDTPLGYFKT